MKLRISNTRLTILCQAIGIVLLAGSIYAAETPQQFEAGKKAKVTGIIQSRNGDLVTIKVKKLAHWPSLTLPRTQRSSAKRPSGCVALTWYDRNGAGLTIDVEGVGNTKGQLDASTISFDPDTFAVEVAEEQQIEANKAAAAQAQSTANQGVAAADQAQASANQAQQSANQAGQTARVAGVAAVMDAQAIQMVNQRVSDLADYKSMDEALGDFIETPLGHAAKRAEQEQNQPATAA